MHVLDTGSVPRARCRSVLAGAASGGRLDDAVTGDVQRMEDAGFVSLRKETKNKWRRTWEGRAHLVQTPLPEYDPAGHAAPQLVPSCDRPVPASPPAQHSPLAQDEVQAVAPVTVCVAMVQLV